MFQILLTGMCGPLFKLSVTARPSGGTGMSELLSSLASKTTGSVTSVLSNCTETRFVTKGGWFVDKLCYLA